MTVLQILDQDVSLEREVFKGRGFRLYAARNLGKVVAIKVYEGNHAKEVGFSRKS